MYITHFMIIKELWLQKGIYLCGEMIVISDFTVACVGRTIDKECWDNSRKINNKNRKWAS